jgi:hypothetical protein
MAVATLCKEGFSPTLSFHIINTVTTFVTGHTLAESGSTPGNEESDPDMEGLESQLDYFEFPCFSEAIECGLGSPEDHQARFEFGLDALFAGLVMMAIESRQHLNENIS